MNKELLGMPECYLIKNTEIMRDPGPWKKMYYFVTFILLFGVVYLAFKTCGGASELLKNILGFV